MSRYRYDRSGIAIALAAVLLAAKTTPAHPNIGGCDVNSPHAASFIASANATFPHLDSLRAARLGWYKTPSSVTLVKEQKKCDAIVAALVYDSTLKFTAIY